jgi:hypothetical protein
MSDTSMIEFELYEANFKYYRTECDPTIVKVVPKELNFQYQNISHIEICNW